MNGDRADEWKLLDNMSRDFASRELRVGREERDAHPFAPLDLGLLRKAEELGFFSLFQDEGEEVAANLRALCRVLENLAIEDASFAGAVFTHALAELIMRLAGRGDIPGKLREKAGNGGQEEGRLPLVAFPCFDAPEETARGLRAEKRDDNYLLTGRAEFVVLGNVAGWALLPAYIEGMGKYSFFLTPLKGQGVEVGNSVLSLGLRSCPGADLALQEVVSGLIGEAGEGERYYASAVDLLSACAAAMSLGVMRGSFREALDYARQRVQGGREIINWSEVRMILSQMALHCRAGGMLVDAALREAERGERGWEASSWAAALQVQETACQVASDGVQLLGGNGYMRDYGQEKRFRDAHQLKVLLGHHPLRKLKFLQLAEGVTAP